MDMFSLTIETGNAAFDDGLGSELARILEALANRVNGEYNQGEADSGTIRDINGNKVGEWELS